ncbi:hypothetical protein NP493_4127g00005 [Ridgeia piscesae]|nr:hypothetical protein NP493_4127g00005 [Ridgeia piscesae]
MATSDVSDDEMKPQRGAVAMVQGVDVATTTTTTTPPTTADVSGGPGHIYTTHTQTVDLLTAGDKDFIDRVLTETNNKERVAEMIKEHVKSMEDLQRRKRDFTADHAHKLHAKLCAQMNKVCCVNIEI